MADYLAQLDDHAAVFERCRELVPQIEKISLQIVECLRAGGTVFWMGNGGSAAEAQHFSTELVGRLNRERAGLSSIALNADAITMTAIANDYGYDQVFSGQVEALCKPGDVIAGISTSGNSRNIIEAIRLANQKDIITIGMSGKNGGELRKISDLCLCVPSDDTQRIQDGHLFIGHIICEYVENDLSSDEHEN
jgi:D-sedoheptulose 7-phosphate isomerase